MNETRFYQNINKLLVLLVSIALIVYGNRDFYMLTYLLAAVLLSLRALMLPTRKRIKTQMIVLYLLFLIFQFGFIFTIFAKVTTTKLLLAKILGLCFFITPFTFENIFLNDDYTRMYFPNKDKVTTFSYSFFKEYRDELIQGLDNVKHMRKGVTAKNLHDVITDLPRHGYLGYVNNGTLGEEYFKEAQATLDDHNVYIILSNTGTSAGELIGAFTKRVYAHSSIAFDKDLKTIISFNGGQKIDPPGLNHETLEFFNNKPDSSIIVYRLKTTREQKEQMIQNVRKINEEGSAYNIIGIIRLDLNKPNMMLCSQFIYVLLKSVGLEYFDKEPNRVKPTDLVELDYHRNLEFEYEIYLNDRK
jgi:hypothetical protein